MIYREVVAERLYRQSWERNCQVACPDFEKQSHDVKTMWLNVAKDAIEILAPTVAHWTSVTHPKD